MRSEIIKNIFDSMKVKGNITYSDNEEKLLNELNSYISQIDDIEKANKIEDTVLKLIYEAQLTAFEEGFKKSAKLIALNLYKGVC